MAKHRTYSTEFKRQVAQEYIAGETLTRTGEAPRCVPQPNPYLPVLQRKVRGRVQFTNSARLFKAYPSEPAG